MPQYISVITFLGSLADSGEETEACTGVNNNGSAQESLRPKSGVLAMQVMASNVLHRSRRSCCCPPLWQEIRNDVHDNVAAGAGRATQKLPLSSMPRGSDHIARFIG